MVKGYEYSRGQYVVLGEEELRSLEHKSDHGIEIEEFVPIDRVDPLYFEKSNLLGPDKGGQKAYRLLNEAAACLREGIVDDKDLLDAGVIFGTGFAPFRGGPLNYSDDIGANTLQQNMKIYQQRFGERFAPDEGWSQV